MCLIEEMADYTSLLSIGTSSECIQFELILQHIIFMFYCLPYIYHCFIMPNRHVLHLRLSRQTRGCVNIHFDGSITRIVLCNGANNSLIHQWNIYIYNLQGNYIFGVKKFEKVILCSKNIFMNCYFLDNLYF